MSGITVPTQWLPQSWCALPLLTKLFLCPPLMPTHQKAVLTIRYRPVFLLSHGVQQRVEARICFFLAKPTHFENQMLVSRHPNIPSLGENTFV